MKIFLNIDPSLIAESQSPITPKMPLDEIDAIADSIKANMTKDVKIPKEVLNSFQLKEGLNQDIWIKNTLNPKIAIKLIKIASDFFKDLDLPADTEIKDIIFTGSLANFNWSKYSDIDLHIVIDFKQFDAQPKFVEEYFYAQKSIWNQEHDIKVFGFPIELYVQDINAKLVATAVYSVLKNKWIKKPHREAFQLDKKAIKYKAEQIIYNLRDIRQDYQDNQFQAVVDKVKKLKNKIKQMRNAGLERGGEFSLENLVFKVLRRTPFMDQLDSFKAKSYDKLMSVSEVAEGPIIDEGEVLDNTKFKYKRDEDDIIITATYNSELVGNVNVSMVQGGYDYFKDEFSEEKYSHLFPDDKFANIVWLQVSKNNYRGEGIAKELMKRAIAKAKQQGYSSIYLNASPIGMDGLNLSDLVDFYRSFGFKEILHQGHNTQMLLSLDKAIDEVEMTPKNAQHKIKKDLETKLGRRLLDSEWNHYLETGQIPKSKATIFMDPQRAAEIQKRQADIEAKIAMIKAKKHR